MKNPCRRAVLALCLGFLVSQVLSAQSDLGTISGFVKDPSGATVPNAKVTVQNQSGVDREATTNESGYYTITNVPPGSYKMSVEASGFKRYESTNNKLDPSAALTVDATLEVGVTRQTVEVSATAAVLQSESASVQKLVSREQIDSLELNGRNPVGLAALVPGARGGTLANLTASFSQGPANFNGSRNPENLITFDGAPATRTRSNGTSLGAADVDSTQEVEILTADYPAEYGRSSGAQIRVVTKSGTQQLHRSAYEYDRNTAFNANTWSRDANPLTPHAAQFQYNQFGYNFGGPLYIPNHFNTDKSKVFFYWGQEWVRYHFIESGSSVGSAGLLELPTVKIRQGDFSELLVPNNPFVTRKDANGKKIPVVVNNPATGLPFPNNVITGNRPDGTPWLSPNGLALLNAYPEPNLATPILGN